MSNGDAPNDIIADAVQQGTISAPYGQKLSLQISAAVGGSCPAGTSVFGDEYMTPHRQCYTFTNNYSSATYNSPDGGSYVDSTFNAIISIPVTLDNF